MTNDEIVIHAPDMYFDHVTGRYQHTGWLRNANVAARRAYCRIGGILP